MEKLYKINVKKSKEGQSCIYNIQWAVPMFKKLLQTHTMSQGFLTPRYTVVEISDTSFQLKMCFFGTNKIDLLEIYYLSCNSGFIQCDVNVRIENGLLDNSLVDYRMVQANEWQYCIGLKNISNTIDSCFFGYLALSFKFTLAELVEAVVCNNLALPHTPLLSEDLGSLPNDINFSDVIMKSVEGIEFKAHKSVLAVHSKVLKAHFEHNMRESITNVVETPLEAEVLRDVLTFMYKDEVPRVDDAPDKLLAAADYYQLDRLKSICEEALYKILTIENAIETLQRAELFSANSLRQSTLKFIKNGRFKLVTKTQGWKNIQSVEFIKRFYDFIMLDETIDILAIAWDEYYKCRNG